MYSSSRNSVVITTFLFFIIIITTNFFAYITWNKTIGGRVLKIVDLFLIFFYFQNLTKIKNAQIQHFKTEISHILWFSFFSIIGSFLLYGTNPINSLSEKLDHAFILIYFVLHFKQVEEKHLIKILLILSIIITLLLFIQQITFPLAPFGLKSIDEVQNPNDIIEIRNGLIRYRIPSHTFLLFIIFFYWDKLSRHIKLITVIPLGIGLLGIYLLLTKQLIATVILTIFLSIFLIHNKKIKAVTFFLLITLCIIGYIYKDVLFSEMLDNAKEQANEDDIRVLSAKFFLNKILNNPIGFFLGHGYIPQLQQWGEKYGYWITDVGFIGETFLYGIFYLFIYIQTLWKIYKYRYYLPLYIKMYILSTLFICIMIFPYRDNTEFITWAIILYICDLYINKSQLRYLQNENRCFCNHNKL